MAVTFVFRLSKPRVSTEPTTRRSITPAAPPITQGSQPKFFPTASLKLDGTEIKITVVLSCPPREFASSTRAREASFKLGFERIFGQYDPLVENLDESGAKSVSAIVDEVKPWQFEQLKELTGSVSHEFFMKSHPKGIICTFF